MADIIADVIRLFITEGSFLGGSKPGQAGFGTNTKRWLIQDLNNPGNLAFGVSDDSLQMLLADSQTADGIKTFTNGILIGADNNPLTGHYISEDGVGMLLESPTNITLETASGELVFKGGANKVASIFSDLTMLEDSQILAISSTTGKAGINLPHGTAPTPNNGDMWTTNDGFFIRIFGRTIQRATGTGTPEAVVTGYIGDLYTDKNGGAGTTLYVKESGDNTNTGWVAK